MQVTFCNESFKHAFQLERLFHVKYFEIIMQRYNALVGFAVAGYLDSGAAWYFTVSFDVALTLHIIHWNLDKLLSRLL